MPNSLRRVVISLWGDRRIILYPQGGLEIERKVRGIGWRIDNGEMADDALQVILDAANAITGHAASLYAPAECDDVDREHYLDSIGG